MIPYTRVVEVAHQYIRPPVQYRLGAEVGLSQIILTPGFVPQFLDCSEATQLTWWASGIRKNGSNPPDGVWQQCQWLSSLGLRITPDMALRLPGRAIAKNYGPTGSGGSGNHIAITLGDGVHVIEARNRVKDCGVFDGRNRGWTEGYNLPGCVDLPLVQPPVPLPPPVMEDPDMRLARGNGPGRASDPNQSVEQNVRGNGYALVLVAADGLLWIPDDNVGKAYRAVYGAEILVDQTWLDAVPIAGAIR